MASNTRIGLLWAVYEGLAIATDAKQVNYSYLIDSQLFNGIRYVATSWQLHQRISLFSNFGQLTYYNYSTLVGKGYH